MRPKNRTIPVHTFIIAIDKTETLYYNQLEIPKAKVTFDLVTRALKCVSADEIFPTWLASGIELTQAPAILTAKTYIKRLTLDLYDIFNFQRCC
ncbi:hypothetical protein P175DRAFT_0498078 [Aspergillus ochraceoroseus IBT 24754]|uniref:Uncharacterized protein n=1 Tax=Aspergillus ochraceoroseus IBT 24754 TaxID=1392256 RepID=A0A2T5M8Y0_9EURO|nr:uncharacterized protein P175DRAFT_0498078 [Aspergillus ochraceoroseus IBT 24754]PTU24974.1 hypothetical protein P175DRAFT_0498078 [Aspergillus ochraceoroseus IBT 24754]